MDAPHRDVATWGCRLKVPPPLQEVPGGIRSRRTADEVKVFYQRLQNGFEAAQSAV